MQPLPLIPTTFEEGKQIELSGRLPTLLGTVLGYLTTFDAQNITGVALWGLSVTRPILAVVSTFLAVVPQFWFLRSAPTREHWSDLPWCWSS